MPKSVPPVSPKRAAANRANAARSTGPRTPEGKSRSSQNARKHGFASSYFAVIRVEDLDAVAHIKAGFVATFQPVNPAELFAIERMALAQHSLTRSYRMESGLVTNGFDEALDSPATPRIINPEITTGAVVTGGQNHNFWLATGFRQVNRKGTDWQLFLRYQAQAERLLRRATEEFERLKALRGELPNEPIVEPEIEIIEPLTVPEEDLPLVADPPELQSHPASSKVESHPPSSSSGNQPSPAQNSTSQPSQSEHPAPNL